VEKSAMTEGQLYAYEKFWMAVVDERILREAATKKGYNEGMQKGIEEGMQKGIEEGMQKGIEEGMQKGIKEGMQKGIKEGMQKGIKEGMQKGLYLVARNMKQMELPIADIAKATGLSEEEIAEL